jgi:hypothetical protein
MIFLRCLICLLSTAGSVFLELGDSANTALWIIHMIHWFASYVILFSGISYNRFTPVFLLFALFLFTGLTNIEEGENLVTNMLQASTRSFFAVFTIVLHRLCMQMCHRYYGLGVAMLGID